MNKRPVFLKQVGLGRLAAPLADPALGNSITIAYPAPFAIETGASDHPQYP